MNTKAIQVSVRWARKRAGMTQHDLAEAVGMPQPSIARIEAIATQGHNSLLNDLLPGAENRQLGRNLRAPVQAVCALADSHSQTSENPLAASRNAGVVGTFCQRHEG